MKLPSGERSLATLIFIDAFKKGRWQNFSHVQGLPRIMWLQATRRRTAPCGSEAAVWVFAV